MSSAHREGGEGFNSGTDRTAFFFHWAKPASDCNNESTGPGDDSAFPQACI